MKLRHAFMTALYYCSGCNLQLATMLMECHGVGDNHKKECKRSDGEELRRWNILNVLIGLLKQLINPSNLS